MEVGKRGGWYFRVVKGEWGSGVSSSEEGGVKKIKSFGTP